MNTENLPPHETTPSSVAKVQAAEILNKFQKADNPLEFVTKNIAAKQSSVAVSAQSADINPPKMGIDDIPLPDIQTSTDANTATTTSIQTEIPVETEKTPVVAADIPDPSEEEIQSYNEKIQKRIRGLVKKRKELAAQLEAVAAEKETYLSELEQYKTGAVVPDKVRELEQKNVELSRYQKLFDIKASDEYQQQYVQPLTNLVQQARDFAQTYGIDASVFDHALTLQDEKSINQLLASELGDVVATTEAKQIVKQIKNLHSGMQQLEKSSAEELNNLWQRQQEERIQRKSKALDNLSKKTKSAWVSAIKEIQESKQFPELMLDPANEEHNKIVRPILDESAREYGRLVKIFAEHGMEDIPDEAAKILAKYIPIGRAAHIIAASRNSYANHAKEIESNAEKYSALLRPGIGSSRPSPTSAGEIAPKRAPRTSEQAAKELASKFFGS